jgi:DNA polymerase III subunit beta
MKVNVERSVLVKALSHVHRVVEKRNTIPILSNVLLRAQNGALHLKATDLDLEITEQLEADTQQEGATTVPAHMFYDIVRKLPEGAQLSLELEEGGTQLLIKSGRARFYLQALPQDEFPDLSAGDLPHSFTLKGVLFKQLIDKTFFAVSLEETRYYLNGVYLHTIEHQGKTVLRTVATDGHRLARDEVDAPQGSQGMAGVIIPRKAVAEIQKLLEGTEEDLTVQVSGVKIRFSIGSVVLTSKLIDGTFPDYQRVIPANNDKPMVVERAAFMAAVDRVSTISSERGRAVKLALASNVLSLSVTSPDSGSALEEVEIDYDSDEISIGFNARYLLDVTSQLESDTILFKFSDANAPTLIQDRESATALYVLMPMRV